MSTSDSVTAFPFLGELYLILMENVDAIALFHAEDAEAGLNVASTPSKGEE